MENMDLGIEMENLNLGSENWSLNFANLKIENYWDS